MVTRSDVIKFIVEEFYDNDMDRAAAVTGFGTRRLQNWMDGTRTPQKRMLEWVLYRTFVPDFEIIAEYKPIDANLDVSLRAQLSEIFKGHEKSMGIYAFYDSMANLIYLGKANGTLMNECYQQLRAPLNNGGLFPRGAKQPERRHDVVKYISAYHINSSGTDDYAKHVESLILRISKPRLNKNIGNLEHAERPED